MADLENKDIFKSTRKNKYNAKRKIYKGRSYHSIKEGNYAEKLDWLKRAGEIQDWQPQFNLKLDINGSHITNYRMDFKVINNAGQIEMHEVKGVETALWKVKWKLAKALYPQYIFVLIK